MTRVVWLSSEDFMHPGLYFSCLVLRSSIIQSRMVKRSTCGLTNAEARQWFSIATARRPQWQGGARGGRAAHVQAPVSRSAARGCVLPTP